MDAAISICCQCPQGSAITYFIDQTATQPLVVREFLAYLDRILGVELGLGQRSQHRPILLYLGCCFYEIIVAPIP